MFKSAGYTHPHPRYQEGGIYYKTRGSGENSTYYGTVCKNCGYPYGLHTSTRCPSRKQYSILGDVVHPIFLHRLKELKLL